MFLNVKGEFKNQNLIYLTVHVCDSPSVSKTVFAIECYCILSGHPRSIDHFRVLLCLCFKTSLSAKLSYENEVCTQFHFCANQSHFHKNDFALRLALKQRHRGT